MNGKYIRVASLVAFAACASVSCTKAFPQDGKALLQKLSKSQKPETALVFKLDDAIVDLVAGKGEAIYAATASGDIFKAVKKGKPEKIASALNRGGFSFRSIALLPNGDLAYSDYVEDKDRVVRLDALGNKTDIATIPNSILSLSATGSGEVLVGVWKSEGDIGLNLNPRYLNGADSMSGEILAIKADATQSSIYEGGLPVDICIGSDGAPYASVWGKKGEFRPKRKSYSIADPVHMFFIGLSDDTRIIADPGAESGAEEKIFSGALTALSLIQAIGKDAFLGYGISKEGKTGLYLLRSGADPIAIPLDQDRISDITGLAVSEGKIYASYRDGSVYRFY